MSQYVDIKVKVTNKAAALAALEALGLKVQLDDTGKQGLTTYYNGTVGKGDSLCHLKVSRDQLGGGCNDFGVDLNTGHVWICDYAQKGSLKTFMQEYAFEVTKQHYAEQGKYVYREDDKATGKIFAYVDQG